MNRWAHGPWHAAPSTSSGRTVRGEVQCTVVIDAQPTVGIDAKQTLAIDAQRSRVDQRRASAAVVHSATALGPARQFRCRQRAPRQAAPGAASSVKLDVPGSFLWSLSFEPAKESDPPAGADSRRGLPQGGDPHRHEARKQSLPQEIALERHKARTHGLPQDRNPQRHKTRKQSPKQKNRPDQTPSTTDPIPALTSSVTGPVPLKRSSAR